MTTEPIRLVLLNDFKVVVVGLAALLEPYADRVRVLELDVNRPATQDCDIVLYDTFAAEQGENIDADDVLKRCRADQVVVYTWNLDAALAKTSVEHDAVGGYLSKQLSAEGLVSALERIHAGEVVVSPELPDAGLNATPADPPAGDWPGREEGLSAREAEVLAYIVEGFSNQDLADRAYLSINTVKSYIRSAYRKMGVTTRSQALLWGIDHGFRRDRARLAPDGEEL